LFFTRWITHFCAPTFLFLSGLSTYVAGQGKNAGEYSNFIIKRGLFLVAFELLIMNPIFSFNPFFNFIFLQVIWAIGMSMIVLGLLMKTSY
ncbi:heparan-alpha-glucosaminide N-acetyltransferase domain-containing protein, partial [Escherichia coli]|nr:heparan-alpha-glucosaminide N-acetyltransferase domain-containing protein [Escherichia coli]